MPLEVYDNSTPLELQALVEAIRERDRREHARQCYYAGIVAAQVINVHLTRGRRVRATDFVPQYEEDLPKLTSGAGRAALAAWARTHNANTRGGTA